MLRSRAAAHLARRLDEGEGHPAPMLNPTDIRTWLAETWARLIESPGSEAAAESVARIAATEAPVVWLLGKVQSGKSSIVQAITGASRAEIGSGFRPCTRTAEVFDFPAEAPVIRFLDTRGLGEVGYDPSEDLAFAEGKAHLVLVVARAMDHRQEVVLDALRQVCVRRPDWPVLVALTCLHEAYPAGAGHVLPYPFRGEGPLDARVPEPLARSLARHRQIFDEAAGAARVRFVPIDLTREDDDLEPHNYGLEALLVAIAEAAPEGLAAMVTEMRRDARAAAERGAHSLILGHAAAAAAADIVPVAGALAVPGVQTRLLHVLASREGIAWDRRALTEFGGCLGASILTRIAAGFGIRQLAKLVPVYGQTVGAAAAAATSFATTYALGRAALVFLAQRDRSSPDRAAVLEAYNAGLAEAFRLARERGLGDGAKPPADTPSNARGSDGPR